MLVWSKVLAVALSATLLGFGATAVQAKDHKAQSCPTPQTPQTCPAPVLEKPAPISGPCCQIPEVQQRCPQTGCCLLDQGYVSKEEKKALEKRHDAVKAFHKQQKAIAKANDELDKKYAKEQRRIDKANAHLNHEVAEFLEVNGPSEAVAEAKAVLPEPEIERAKPIEPEPAPVIEPTPAPTVEPTPAPTPEISILQVEPTPAPTPTPVEKPKALPKTASDLSLIGLIGLVSTMTGYVTRFFRS
jgi:hypothetical protein